MDPHCGWGDPHPDMFFKKNREKGENNPSAGGAPALRMEWAASRYDLLFNFKIRKIYFVGADGAPAVRVGSAAAVHLFKSTLHSFLRAFSFSQLTN